MVSPSCRTTNLSRVRQALEVEAGLLAGTGLVPTEEVAGQDEGKDEREVERVVLSVRGRKMEKRKMKATG